MPERAKNLKTVSLTDAFRLIRRVDLADVTTFGVFDELGDRSVFTPPALGRFSFPSSYLLLHPQDVLDIWVKNQDKLDKQGPVYDDWRSLAGNNLFLMKRGEDWKIKQKLIGRSIQPKNFGDLKDTVIKSTSDMLDGFEIPREGEKAVVDLYRSLKYLGFRLSSQFLLGKDASEEEAAGVSLALNTINQFSITNTLLGGLPNRLYRHAPSVFWGVLKAHEHLDDYAASAIRTDSSSPLIQALIQTGPQGSGVLSSEQIRCEVIGMIETSFGTTAAATAWTLYLLSLPENRHSQQLAREEAVSGKPTESPASYTSRVIKESLRLFPPAYNNLRTATDDISIDNPNGALTIPAGSNIGISPFLMQRDPRFWTNPRDFDPDRFLEKPVEGSYMPFGAGERRCIGEHYAAFVAANIISATLKRYEISSIKFPAPKFSSSLKPSQDSVVSFRSIG